MRGLACGEWLCVCVCVCVCVLEGLGVGVRGCTHRGRADRHSAWFPVRIWTSQSALECFCWRKEFEMVHMFYIYILKEIDSEGTFNA
jgi:hypothetical protein